MEPLIDSSEVASRNDAPASIAWLAVSHAVAAFPEASSIAIFDPAGGRTVTLGRRGAGPTDLAEPCCLSSPDDSTLLVLDPPNARLQRYRWDSGAATHLGSLKAPIFAAAAAAPVAAGAQGHYFLLLPHVRVEDGTQQYRVVEVDAEGTLVRTDTIPARGALTSATKSTASAGGGYTVVGARVRFGAGVLAALGRGGRIAYANSSDPTVEFHWTPTSRPDSVVLGHEGPLFTAEERTAIREQLKSLGDDGYQIRSAPGERKPPLRSLGFDTDGRLWIELAVSGPYRVAEVIEPSGATLGRWAWPSTITFPGWAIQGEHAIGVETMPDGDVRMVRVTFARR